MGLELVNMLSWWQWLILALLPPAIVLLYFLKLKRRPVEVPSTYLWRRSIEDLHVNTVWQRLRRNLLLLLQLLLLVFLMVAMVRPGWQGTKLQGNRFIFLVDNSASMQATDGDPTRLEEAKRQARKLVDEMESGDVGMVVSFAASARVQQEFTDSRTKLRRAIDDIRPTAETTSLGEALKVASGLANPGRTSNREQNIEDVPVADPLPATVYLFSDGQFEDVSGFALGNLDVQYRPIGRQDAGNVGILALSVGQHESRPNQFQAFARLQNFAEEPVTVTAEVVKRSVDAAGVWGTEEVINATQVELDAEEAKGVALDVGEIESGVVRVQLAVDDRLTLDNQAWAVVNPPRRARVLVLSPGNDPLRFALGTESALEIADVTFEMPSFLDEEAYRQQASGAKYDLVIYDRCRPKQMPQANTVFMGSLPLEGWNAEKKVGVPQIIDIDPSHPMMQYMDLSDVILVEGTPLKPPTGGRTLIDSQVGPMFALSPRERFEDAVLGFVLVEEQAGNAGKTERFIGTNWPIRPSFPVFIFNVLNYLGGRKAVLGSSAVRPGQPVALEIPVGGQSPKVRSPQGEETALGSTGGNVSFTKTSELGVYDVLTGSNRPQHFAVNLFHALESDLRPRTSVKIGNVNVAGEAASVLSRKELWRLLLVCALGVLLLEWYIYNRRVYI